MDMQSPEVKTALDKVATEISLHSQYGDAIRSVVLREVDEEKKEVHIDVIAALNNSMQKRDLGDALRKIANSHGVPGLDSICFHQYHPDGYKGNGEPISVLYEA